MGTNEVIYKTEVEKKTYGHQGWKAAGGWGW